MAQPQDTAPPSSAPARRAPERTCVGCGKRDASQHLLRLVLGPEGQVAFDLADHAVGRGAHVHPVPACLDLAARKGLSRAFHTNVACDPAALRDQLAEAVERRLRGLLGSAIQSGNVVLGRQAVDAGLGKNEIELILMACDASDAPGPALMRAIADGRAVAWGSRVQLGAALGRSDVAVVGIRSPSLGKAIAEVCRIADGVRSCSEVR
ncbi:MAG: hypothetical protein CVU63_05970 [Deltaproteobacteria bacterium HGW-Deltaproteobacteria-20]|nr:MAG: hypothetical protein CVU63_05970 [Deltaproteobacteria bacterium HGW-Deltaproteobacteria-20]